jgi:hypothetical protein
MTSGSEDPTRLRVNARSPHAIDVKLGIRVARFPGGHAGMMEASLRDHHIKAGDARDC